MLRFAFLACKRFGSLTDLEEAFIGRITMIPDARPFQFRVCSFVSSGLYFENVGKQPPEAAAKT